MLNFLLFFEAFVLQLQICLPLNGSFVFAPHPQILNNPLNSLSWSFSECTEIPPKTSEFSSSFAELRSLVYAEATSHQE